MKKYVKIDALIEWLSIKNAEIKASLVDARGFTKIHCPSNGFSRTNIKEKI